MDSMDWTTPVAKKARHVLKLPGDSFPTSPLLTPSLSTKGNAMEETPCKLERGSSRKSLGADLDSPPKRKAPDALGCILEDEKADDMQLEKLMLPQQKASLPPQPGNASPAASLQIPSAATKKAELSTAIEFELNGETYRVHDRSTLVGQVVTNTAGPQAEIPAGNATRRKGGKRDRSLAALRRRREAARQAEAQASGEGEVARQAEAQASGSADTPGVPAPGTPPPRERKAAAREVDETEKLPNPFLREAFARAVSASQGVEFVDVVEDDSTQIERALKNYEDYYKLSRGSARAEDVANSSAGIAGWAGPGPARRVVRYAQAPRSDAAGPRFAGPSLSEEMGFSPPRAA